MTTDRPWHAEKTANFVREVKEELRGGWTWLSARLQRALIAEKAFQVVRSQPTPPSIEIMNWLLEAMEAEAGIGVPAQGEQVVDAATCDAEAARTRSGRWHRAYHVGQNVEVCTTNDTWVRGIVTRKTRSGHPWVKLETGMTLCIPVKSQIRSMEAP